MEIWKDIEGYIGLYQISNFGRVKSLPKYGGGKGITTKEIILKQMLDKDGYYVVNLYNNKKLKTHKVHRLVAISFISNPNNYQQVNHKDECKTNNHIDNLEWCNTKYNINYGTAIKRRTKKLYNNKVNSKQVLCVETNIIYPSTKEVERCVNIYHGDISKCCKCNEKTAGGYHWKFLNDT